MMNVVGHEKIIKDLKKINDRGSLGHGYIFYGPSMVGKKLVAVEFAKFLENSENSGGKKVLSDMMLIEAGEASSIGIDAVREIRNFLWQKPNVSPRRTLVIDDAELMTMEAQNALLKITEEPPASSLLILVTSDIESILPTITSRLPKIYFGAVQGKEIETWIKNPKIADQSFGKPGLAWRLEHDEAFQEQLALAEKLLKTPPATRRDVIKKIIEPDDFNFRKLLDAILLQLAWSAKTREGGTLEKSKATTLWHKTLQLYHRETNFSLNPRLQLENLLL